MHDLNLDKPVDTHWKPVASLEQLRARSKVIRLIRSFFEARDVLEVETVQDFAIADVPFDQLAHDHRQQLQDYLAGKVTLA